MFNSLNNTQIPENESIKTLVWRQIFVRQQLIVSVSSENNQEEKSIVNENPSELTSNNKSSLKVELENSDQDNNTIQSTIKKIDSQILEQSFEKNSEFQMPPQFVQKESYIDLDEDSLLENKNNTIYLEEKYQTNTDKLVNFSKNFSL